MSIEEISARLEIQQTLTDYATAVDAGTFEHLDAVFTADATIDYGAMGGIVGDRAQATAWLAEVLPNFSAYCHLMGNHDIRVDGESATSRTLCLNPMQTSDKSTFLLGLWYRDTWHHTADGWRITARTLEKCFDTPL